METTSEMVNEVLKQMDNFTKVEGKTQSGDLKVWC